MILETIAARAAERVTARKAQKPLAEVKAEALALGRQNAFAFEKALSGKDFSLICEVKKASPSKGVIAVDFPYRAIAADYERAGAAAISVLTEPDFFQGDDRYLSEIKEAVGIPVLRKDFTIDEYQLYEAKCIGADAVLLICALLPTEALRRYIAICDKLGLSCLVEAHDAAEVKSALAAGARVIGVNNRNLRDFSVDMENSLRLRALVPPSVRFVSESGIQTPEDIARLRQAGVDAALVGETLMRSADKLGALAALYGEKPRAKLKLCGLTRPKDVAAVNDCRPDYVGFVFAESRRRVSPENAAALKARLAPGIEAVGVFVNEAPARIAALLEAGVIDLAQLHGDEDERAVRALKRLTAKPVIKAVRVGCAADLAPWKESTADYLLLDARAPKAYGGTGRTFDWDLAAGLARPFFLAGGIGARNAAAAIRRAAPYALDVSSGAETDGVKDGAKIAQITEIVRRITQ